MLISFLMQLTWNLCYCVTSKIKPKFFLASTMPTLRSKTLKPNQMCRNKILQIIRKLKEETCYVARLKKNGNVDRGLYRCLKYTINMLLVPIFWMGNDDKTMNQQVHVEDRQCCILQPFNRDYRTKESWDIWNNYHWKSSYVCSQLHTKTAN